VPKNLITKIEYLLISRCIAIAKYDLNDDDNLTTKASIEENNQRVVVDDYSTCRNVESIKEMDVRLVVLRLYSRSPRGVSIRARFEELSRNID
jgi:hypothetical protein